MAKNRKAFVNTVLDGIERLLPGSQNTQMYKEFFSGLSDDQLEQFVNDLRAGRKHLAIIAPNFGAEKLTVERNLQIAKEWGHNFFTRIWMNPGNGIPPYLTPRKYAVFLLPLGRQAQHLVKKISIPEDNKSIDDLTGQPTGSSQGSKISYPEMQILTALNLDDSIIEFMKYRGGDIKGFNSMMASINKTGGVSLRQLDKAGTKVKSTVTLATYLTGMHLSNNAA